MQLYYKDGESFNIHQLRAMYPRKIMPDNADLHDLGYKVIEQTPQPSFDPVTEGLREVEPIDSKQTWEVYPLPNDVLTVNLVQRLRTERELAKAGRQALVDSIKVTTSSGKVFDGDETSQTRMARAILGMQAAAIDTITWVLANNSTDNVTVSELVEALILAGQEQSRLWILQGVSQ